MDVSLARRIRPILPSARPYTSADEAEERLRSTLGRIRVEPHRAGPFELRHGVAEHARTALLVQGIGEGTTYRPAGDRRFVAATTMIAGTATILSREGRGSAGRATMFLSHTDGTDRIDWHGPARHVTLRIPTEVLEARAAVLLGHTLDGPLRFDLDARPPSRAFLRALQCFAETVADGAPAALIEAQRDLLAMTLLLGNGSSLTRLLEAARGGAAPVHVRRAESFIAAHHAEPITLAEITAAAGVGASALGEAFRRFRGTTPMRHLLAVRLDAARAALASGRAHSVADAAFAAGFTHLGRFSESYRARFGEAPSETFRR